MSSEGFKRKLSAILSADVKGYSRLMGDDELATIETLKKYRQLICSLVDQFQGHVVDSPGDNILAEFGSVVDAVQCAVKIQEELKKENNELPENSRMEFRIGVNLGDVVEDGDRIYGDGVNIAARIESLANGGGICLSRNAFDQVKNKVSAGYEFLGEHSVKNIKDPVEVYRLLPDAEIKGSIIYKRRRDDPRHRRRATIIALIILAVVVAIFLVWHFYFPSPKVAPASIARMAYPLPDKPSVAVLPFTNISGDPKQDFIGDGISENITSALSKIGGMFVIASDSSLKYKEKLKKVKDVAEGFGVQYVLKGSVQKSEDQLRVTVQLIDALTGHLRWSEKYDRQMKELFDLQDEITKKIVVSLQIELTRGEEAIIEAKSTENFEAWSKVAQGYSLVMRMNKEDTERARKLFEDAIKFDPNYAAAWAWLATSYLWDLSFGWSKSPIDTAKRVQEACQKALAIDNQQPLIFVIQGFMHIFQKEYEKALAKGKKALTIAPNLLYAYCLLQTTMYYLGRFEESIEENKKAMRLSPYYPATFLVNLGDSYFFLGRYEEAIETFNQYDARCQKGECPTWRAQFLLAKVYAEVGREEEARALIEEALKLNPNYSLEDLKRMPFKNPAHRLRLIDAYRKAGMPEKPPRAVP